VEISTLAIRLQIIHDFESCNCYTTAPLVIKQAQLDSPRQEGHSCKQIDEHKQEGINTQSKIANMNDANINGVFENLVPKD